MDRTRTNASKARTLIRKQRRELKRNNGSAARRFRPSAVYWDEIVTRYEATMPDDCYTPDDLWAAHDIHRTAERFYDTQSRDFWAEYYA